MMEYRPNYTEYKKILEAIKASGKLMDYLEAKDSSDGFLVLRHDVEFSMERAYRMAQIEESGGCQHLISSRLQTMHIMHCRCRAGR